MLVDVDYLICAYANMVGGCPFPAPNQEGLMDGSVSKESLLGPGR